jgi:hybrid cluster-associated redox disulfide protein
MVAKKTAKKGSAKKPSKPAAKKASAKASPAKTAKISKGMLIGDVVSRHPETVQVMFKHGMHCIGCGMTAYESIEQGCMGHGMTGKEIDAMVDEMNKAAKED